MWQYENLHDLNVYSTITEFTIIDADWHVLCFSRMKYEIELSTMVSYYVELIITMIELLKITCLVKGLAETIGLEY